MSHKPEKTAAGTQSIERTIAILKELATFGKTGGRISDIVPRVRLEYPTVHRILKCLAAQNMVDKDPHTLRYSLGKLVYELGLSAPPKTNLREICDPVTSRIAEQTGDTVFLNVRSELDIVCIDRKEGTFPIKTLIFEIGNRRPLGIGAGGLALLMNLADEEIQNILRLNAARMSSYGELNPRSLAAAIRRYRDIGYVATEDVVVKGVSAVSLPFGGRDGMPAAAISIAAVPSRMPGSRHREVVKVLQGGIQDLERLLQTSARVARRAA
jgi:DNA-binding IclR family transcriptional regulator